MRTPAQMMTQPLVMFCISMREKAIKETLNPLVSHDLADWSSQDLLAQSSYMALEAIHISKITI